MPAFKPIARIGACAKSISANPGARGEFGCGRLIKVSTSVVALFVIAATSATVAAEKIPLPRPAPLRTVTPDEAPAESEPSDCRLRLTEQLAVAPSLPPIDHPPGCVVSDVVHLEAIVLKNGSRVAVTPPATLRCTMAEEIVGWVRDDVASAVRELGSPLRGVDNAASFDCRGVNNIPGARLSEHGLANALDIGALRLSDGKLVKLTDPHVARDFRENIKRSACTRFSTVLGPGSDGFHEEHIHVDLKELAPRRSRLCHWDVREPEPEEEGVEIVPLPRPRPDFERDHAARRR
jgi:hypothetical protein